MKKKNQKAAPIQPAVNMDIKGLKCDAPGCGYTDKTTWPSTAAEIMSLVGRPCPKCGASLLTPEDAASVLQLQGVVAIVNAAYVPEMVALAKDGGPVKRAKVDVKFKGDGSVVFGPVE